MQARNEMSPSGSGSDSSGSPLSAEGLTTSNGQHRRSSSQSSTLSSRHRNEQQQHYHQQQQQQQQQQDGQHGKAKRHRNSKACTWCQRLKMKCSAPAEGPCERCKRTGHECIVVERACRRPWTKKKDMQIQQLTDRIRDMEQVFKASSSILTVPGDSKAIPGFPMDAAGNAATAPLAQATATSTTGEGLDPAVSSMLSGQLELNAASTAVAPALASLGSENTIGSKDHLSTLPFVSTGCITADEAIELFDLFMRRCAFQTVMLDPSYHTVSHVSQTSPFLWACIVYLASTYATAKPTLRDELQAEMDWFVGWAVTSGEKKVEVVQGFLLLYFWNRPSADPSMDRAWLYAGIGIRMATELLGTSNPGISDAERINRERTWLMTFLVDRSLSMAAGRPWTIRSDTVLIRDSDSWCQQPLSQPWDLGISALADLLKLTSRQIDVLSSSSKTWAPSAAADSGNRSATVDFDCETMMRIYNDELETYRRTWEQRGFFSSPQQSTSPEDDIHLFTMYYVTKQATLRYNYAVLVLNSYGLQYCALNPSKSPPVQSICLPSAISASQNILKAAIEGLGDWLAYAPHTVLSLVGYGAVLLVKLARFTHDAALRQRLLSHVEEAVEFLERVALGPKHKPARLASMIRAVLSSKTPNEDRAAYPPGMEVRGWPVQSSRAGSPSAGQPRDLQQQFVPLSNSSGGHHQQGIQQVLANGQQASGPASAASKHRHVQNIGSKPFGTVHDANGMECSPLTEESDSLASLGLAFGEANGSCAAAWTLPFSPNELFDESFWVKVPEP